MFLCLHVPESIKRALFHVFFHLVPPFIPHYIIMIKGLFHRS